MVNSARLRSLFLAATCLAAFGASATPASAQAEPAADPPRPTDPSVSNDVPSIVIRDGILANQVAPAGSLDVSGVRVGLATGVNGVGQMFSRANVATTGLGLCTGTLINPRTVIFAAHCVNTQAANAYGPNGVATTNAPNGIPLSFGFGADALPGVREWLGLAAVPGGVANPALRHASNPNRAHYNVEQLWYDSRSLAPTSNRFLEGDVALATLDTPAYGVPTWALLFSPLTGPVDVTIMGYGGQGTQSAPAAIDFRRRSAENVLSVLGSLNDQNNWLAGNNPARPNPQSLYQLDFDNPDPAATYNPAQGRFDFNIYGGAARGREGTTAGGDSGGPLIVESGKFGMPIVAGVLSGGSRFFGAQAFSSYGTTSFYQPLFMFWDVIAQNNNYIYAGARAGDGAWEDSSHWVRLMDPAYMVERNGVLVNDLPDTPAVGVSGRTPKFGQVCFLANCTNLADDAEAVPVPQGEGTGLVIAGGPGTSGFSPNNVKANPKAGINARYYDVRLTQAGRTTLGSGVTVDMLTLDGPSILDIQAKGSLRTIGEVNQVRGWINVDGRLASGGDMTLVTGLLSGRGTIEAPFLTSIAATIAPGGADRIGTLTVNGNVILASGTALFVDAQRGSADRLSVNGTLTLSANAQGSGPALVFNKPTDAPAPRFGDAFVIASASNGLSGTFGSVSTFQGVLRPDVTYTGTEVRALLRAGSLVTILEGQDATALAFAKALDQLRTGSYNNLYNLYGAIDWMNGAQLSAMLAGLMPRTLAETTSLYDRQSRRLSGLAADRLSLIGTGQAAGLVTSGQAGLLGGQQLITASARLGLAPGGTRVALGGGLSGFLDMSAARSRSGTDAQGATGTADDWHVASGLELPVGQATIGTAFGLAGSDSRPGSDRAELRVHQAAVYASLPLGSGAYAGSMISGETMRSESTRLGQDGVSALTLRGIGRADRITALVETGIRRDLGTLAITPRAQLAYSQTRLSGFDEKGGETALSLDSITQQRLEGRVGARLDGRSAIGGWSLTPSVQADYVRLLAGGRDGMTVRFAAAPDAPILLPLGDAASGWAELKGGVMLAKGPLSIGLSGTAAVGNSPFADQRGAVDFTFRF